MEFIAHVRTENDGTQHIQTANAHSCETSDFAGESLVEISLSCPARLAGILHDMGKYKQEFQKYILEGGGQRGSVIHTFAGARYMLETYRKPVSPEGDDEQDLTAEIVAYAIAAHHGLFDLENGVSENGFQHRVSNDNCYYEESRDSFLSQCIGKEKIENLMNTAAGQVSAAIDKIFSLPSADPQGPPDDEVAFYMGLLVRIILSAVIDGDRSDTAAFMTGTVCRAPRVHTDWGKCLSRVESKLNTFPAVKPIDIARRKISDQCRACADNPGGILRLNVPTGGGKTLSSLRYALAHASKWNKSRIIFTAPLLTILEQNAAVLRDFIQDDSIILEHHSNVVNDDAATEFMAKHEAYTESWNAPIIITTMVQLFNTMFSAKTSSVRRFHSLADSIIIIDEVQTVPLKLLSLFNLTINFLAGVCGATIVLCSATQPCLEQIEHPLAYVPHDIIPYDSELWNVFKRTELIDGGNCRLEDVPLFAVGVLEHTDSILIVCNKKAEAALIYKAMCGEGNCFHLSASMCTEHRRAVLKSVYESLKVGSRKTICVSTQVIEAGVDISFGAVIRLAAGMDSVIQSAGRCNRNAESDTPAPVYILKIVNENLSALEEIRRGKAATIDLLDRYSSDPESLENDLTSDTAISYYYRKLYSCLARSSTEFPIKGDTVYNLLSLNKHHCKADRTYYYQQAFKTAGEAFKVFDDDSIDVIVPYRSGAEVIAALESPRAAYDFGYMKELIQQANGYTVSVYDYQQKILESENGIRWLFDGTIAVLDNAFYDEDTGLNVERKTMEYLEV